MTDTNQVTAPLSAQYDKLIVQLPPPKTKGETSVEQALHQRHSAREFNSAPLSLQEISQLLWSAQGVTSTDRRRTAPSAGAIYPLETYLVTGSVDNLEAGVYRFDPLENQVARVAAGDRRAALARAALDKTWIADAPALIVFCASYAAITETYWDRGIRYAFMEVGHAAQNVYLQANSIDLGTVVIGAFHDNEVRSILEARGDHHPLAIMPIGRPIHPN